MDEEFLHHMYKNTQASARNENAVFCGLPSRNFGNKKLNI